jgi:ActR/RegA family two-component response regulator
MSFDEFDEELIIGSSDLSAFDAFETLSLEDYKLAYFSKVFYYCHKNIRLTARKLRISEKTVRRLLEKTNWQEHK